MLHAIFYSFIHPYIRFLNLSSSALTLERTPSCSMPIYFSKNICFTSLHWLIVYRISTGFQSAHTLQNGWKVQSLLCFTVSHFISSQIQPTSLHHSLPSRFHSRTTLALWARKLICENHNKRKIIILTVFLYKNTLYNKNLSVNWEQNEGKCGK